MLDKLTAAFDIIFYWCGVWAFMVLGTFAATVVCGAVRRRIARRRMKRFLIAEPPGRVPMPPKPEAAQAPDTEQSGEHQARKSRKAPAAKAK